jgi:hypothetical protein
MGTDERQGSQDTVPDSTVGTGAKENRVVRWFLLEGDRSVITALLSVSVFVGFVALGLTGVIGVTEPGPASGAFTSALTGVFTLVTITVSINQLVLSRVLGSPGDIREWTESVHQFRGTAAELNSRVATSPSDPVGFLEIVARAVREQALQLRETYGAHHDARERAQVEELTGTLLDLANHVDEHVDHETTELYEVLSPILNNSYSRHLNTLRRIETGTDELSTEERAAVGELADALELINRTRHYFKTLYIHEELATVSRRILLTGVPAGVVSFAAILAYAGGLAATAGETTLLVFVSAAIAVVFVPLSVLFAYGVRLATVAARTTTFGTFTPAEEMP